MSATATSDTPLLGGSVVLRQPETGYRVAVDPVLLAAAVNPSKDAHVLDAGCGTGAAALCLAQRRSDVRITGVEMNEDAVRLAADSIALNGVGERVTVMQGDLALLPPELGGPFDAVMTNPPFGAGGTPPPDPAKAAAHMEGHLVLDGWLAACLALLKPRGVLALIHRADRLSEIVARLHGPCGAITVVPLWPKAGRPAKRVIVTAMKGRRSGAVMHPGLVLHNQDGSYTEEAEAILRFGGALAL